MGIDYNGNGTLVLAKEKDNKEFITELGSLIDMADSNGELKIVEDEAWGTVIQFGVFSRRVIINAIVDLFESYLDNIKEAQVWFDTIDDDYPETENGLPYMTFVEVADNRLTKQVFYHRLPSEWGSYCHALFMSQEGKNVTPLVTESNKEEKIDDGLPF